MLQLLCACPWWGEGVNKEGLLCHVCSDWWDSTKMWTFFLMKHFNHLQKAGKLKKTIAEIRGEIYLLTFFGITKYLYYPLPPPYLSSFTLSVFFSSSTTLCMFKDKTTLRFSGRVSQSATVRLSALVATLWLMSLIRLLIRCQLQVAGVSMALLDSSRLEVSEQLGVDEPKLGKDRLLQTVWVG